MEKTSSAAPAATRNLTVWILGLGALALLPALLPLPALVTALAVGAAAVWLLSQGPAEAVIDNTTAAEPVSGWPVRSVEMKGLLSWCHGDWSVASYYWLQICQHCLRVSPPCWSLLVARRLPCSGTQTMKMVQGKVCAI